jgi:hypothetical protein
MCSIGGGSEILKFLLRLSLEIVKSCNGDETSTGFQFAEDVLNGWIIECVQLVGETLGTALREINAPKM